MGDEGIPGELQECEALASRRLVIAFGRAAQGFHLRAFSRDSCLRMLGRDAVEIGAKAPDRASLEAQRMSRWQALQARNFRLKRHAMPATQFLGCRPLNAG